MFENIGVVAEKLATNVSESRRGFLVRVGRAALGMTGVLAGLLVLPTQVQAAQAGYCEINCYGMVHQTTGRCVCPNGCVTSFTCHRRWLSRGVQQRCGYCVNVDFPCVCS